MDQHFCQEHQTRFYLNKKVDADGQVKSWYSHKKADGSGFCVEQRALQPRTEKISQQNPSQLKLQSREQWMDSTTHKMYICNAMNNAVALACNNKIGIDQIGTQFKKLLTELSAAN